MARIIGIILLVLVLAVLYFVTEGDQATTKPTTPSSATQNDNSFKDLKIN
jgi:lipopolysaccharide export system protein LptC